MSRKEAIEQYNAACKRGRKTMKECQQRGVSPYPAVLDHILAESATVGRVELGVVNVPAELIVGTKTEGRQAAFAADFMPLMDVDTEFAGKWIELCTAHLSDEGIRDPIKCYEYLGKLYVQEGNKRTSVLKSYDAPTIPAYVIRLIPAWSEDGEIQAYYDFMRAWQLTGLYQVYFRKAGSFAKLQAALGFEPDHVWSVEERRRFLSSYAIFQSAYRKLGGETLHMTVADAMLTWLKVYPFEMLKSATAAELLKSLKAVWPDVEMTDSAAPIALSTEASDKEPSVLTRIVKSVFPDHLDVAFITSQLPEESDWARAHDVGRKYLEAVMGDKITARTYLGGATEEGTEAAMEKAAAEGAQVIFATTPSMIGACRKTAAKHPDIRILNCSASMPYAGVRTYYSRVYEGKFISGAIAGALCKSGKIGYVASSPTFGVPASINAFALGAQMTNPQARIRLRWSCVDQDPMAELAKEGCEIISNRDIPTPDRMREPWGLCQVWDGQYYSVASPYWHWGNVYVRLVRDILDGSWDAASASRRAVNYWWGIRSGAVGILLRDDVPQGVRQLTELLRRTISDGIMLPFERPIRSQDGTVRSDGTHWFAPEEILAMDWLCDTVDGAIPAYEELLPMARPLVRLQGIYRDAIAPDKEGPIL